MTVITGPNERFRFDLGETRPSSIRRFFPSMLGFSRSLLTRGGSTTGVRVQVKQRFAALAGMTYTQFKVALAWAKVFHQGVGRVGEFGISALVTLARSVLSVFEGGPEEAPEVRSSRSIEPVEMEALRLKPEEIVALLAPKKSPAKPKVEVAKPAPVAATKRAPAVPSSNPWEKEEREKTTVSVFVTRPVALAQSTPLHVDLTIRGA